jgi:hypothetical protein
MSHKKSGTGFVANRVLRRVFGSKGEEGIGR